MVPKGSRVAPRRLRSDTRLRTNNRPMSASSGNLALSALAVAAGAAMGALLRWWLALGLNQGASPLPLGTLAANLIGGYAIGLAIGWLALQPELSPHWRLFIVTGLLGGLTTFSTFSAETVQLLQQGRLAWALLTTAAHLAGSLLLTWAGLATVHAWRG
jgi:fluoride exporter